MKLMRILWMAVLIAALAATFGCGPSAPPEDADKSEESESQGSLAPPADETAEEPSEEPEQMAKVEPPKTEPEPAKKPEAKPKAPTGKPVVVMDTSKGAIKIELDAERAPATVENFLKYVDAKFYDGTIFHRVMPNFMIQGGGFTPGMEEKGTRPPVKNESANGLANLRGTLAMARTSDPHSATAQFFINHGQQNLFLNKDQAQDGWGYAVFGKVIEGMDVVDAIAAVPTTTKGTYSNVPVDPVVIKSVRRAS